MFSHVTWTEFDTVLERWRLQIRVRPQVAADIRSALLDAGDIVNDVVPRFTGCQDPNDNMLLDVLEQSHAQWLCSDDHSVHSLDRNDVVGLGELVRMIREVP